VSATELSGVLVGQFERSWRMVEEAVGTFSAEEWRTGEIDYLTPARLAYHILETAEFYAGESPDGFPFGHRFGCDWEGAQPEELPTQEDVLEYLAEVRSQVETWLTSADLLAADDAFTWPGDTVLDRAVYLQRHTHHHVGEMWSEIKRRGHDLPHWW